MAFAKKHIVPPLFNRCCHCRYGILRDEGYSNYTVEGTSFNCAKGLNPHAPFDNFYEKAPELYFAEKCPSFTKGEALVLDVDGDWQSEFNEDQKSILELERTSKLILQI